FCQACDGFGFNHRGLVGTAVEAVMLGAFFYVNHTLAIFADFAVDADEVGTGGGVDENANFVGHGGVIGLGFHGVRPLTGIGMGAADERFSERDHGEVGVVGINGPR